MSLIHIYMARNAHKQIKCCQFLIKNPLYLISFCTKNRERQFNNTTHTQTDNFINFPRYSCFPIPETNVRNVVFAKAIKSYSWIHIP